MGEVGLAHSTGKAAHGVARRDCEVRDERWRGAAVSADGSMLVEDTHGKGHISRHPKEGQRLILITLPEGLDSPSLGVAVELVG